MRVELAPLARRGVTLLLLAVAATGCSTMGNFAGTPDVLGKGEVGGNVDVGMLGYWDDGGELDFGAGLLGGTVRYGVFDGGEVGLHLGSGGAGPNAIVLTKVRIGDPEGAFRLAVAPSAGVVVVPELHVGDNTYPRQAFFHTQLPLMLGWRPGNNDYVDLVLTPKVGNWTLAGWSAGATAGVALGPRAFQVMPELSASVPISGDAVATFELGLHLIVGPARKREGR